jgi:hypothetical protein
MMQQDSRYISNLSVSTLWILYQDTFRLMLKEFPLSDGKIKLIRSTNKLKVLDGVLCDYIFSVTKQLCPELCGILQFVSAIRKGQKAYPGGPTFMRPEAKRRLQDYTRIAIKAIHYKLSTPNANVPRKRKKKDPITLDAIQGNSSEELF